VIADLVIALSVAVAVLATIDVLLSEGAKEQLLTRTIHLWAWLNDLKQRSLLNWLVLHHADRWIVGIAVLGAGSYAVWIGANRDPLYSTQESGVTVVIISLLLFFVGILLGVVIYFKAFAAACILRKFHQSETQDLEDFVTGSGQDAGIDAAAILLNGYPARTHEDVDFFLEKLRRLDVEFVFVQAKSSPTFSAAKLGIKRMVLPLPIWP
jgi:hypothetical protein